MVLKDYLGRNIRLTSERLVHILDHREMTGLEGLIESSLLQPELVVQSLSDEKVELFYRQLQESRVGVKWLCVIVKFDAHDAFVLTSYLTDQAKRGKQLWP